MGLEIWKLVYTFLPNSCNRTAGMSDNLNLFFLLGRLTYLLPLNRYKVPKPVTSAPMVLLLSSLNSMVVGYQKSTEESINSPVAGP